MATIKDVAKLAGVSLGTVSNVLKGSTSVTLKTTEKVKRAMEELDYHPDSHARHLKSNSIPTVGIVVPDIKNNDFASFYTSAEQVLTEAGFSVNLYLTYDIPVKETECLNRILSQRLVGVLLCTCQPDQSDLFHKFELSDTKLFFVWREPEDFQHHNTIMLSDEESIRNAVLQLHAHGYENLAYIAGPEHFKNEKDRVDGFISGLSETGLSVENCYIDHISFSFISGFQGAIRLIDTAPETDAVICSNHDIAAGILQGFQLLTPEHIPFISALQDTLYTETAAIAAIPHESALLGSTAADLLLKSLQKGILSDTIHHSVRNSPVNLFPDDMTYFRQIDEYHLHIAVPKNMLCQPILSMIPNFEHLYGHRVKVHADQYSMEELHRLLIDPAKNAAYDLFLFDIHWLDELAEKGVLRCLDDLVGEDYLNAIKENRNFFYPVCMHKEHCYAVHFIIYTQLLFYRQDLFANQQYRRQYYETYKTELNPPTTWAEYHAAARFFTRKHNPDSPVEYGISLCGKADDNLFDAFVSRMFSFGAELFHTQGHSALNTPLTLTALNSFLEDYQYANSAAAGFSHGEQALEFASGNSAMMITNTPYVSLLTNPLVSQVIGKFSFTSIPVKKPVTNGLSFGINSAAANTIYAQAFMNWAGSYLQRTRMGMLGDGIIQTETSTYQKIQPLYPWAAHIPSELHNHAVNYHFPDGKTHLNILQLEQMICQMLMSCMQHETSPEQALQETAGRINQMMTT